MSQPNSIETGQSPQQSWLKSHATATVLFVVVISAILIAGWYLAPQQTNQQGQTYQQLKQGDLDVKIPNLSLKYNSVNLGLTLSYPENYELIEDSSSILIAKDLLVYREIGGTNAFLTIAKNNPEYGYEQLKKNLKNIKETSVVIGGVSGKNIEGEDGVGMYEGSSAGNLIYTLLDNGILIARNNSFTEEDERIIFELAEEIINSIEFKSLAIDWKTYESAKYGFKFMYPNDYKVVNNGTALEIKQNIGDAIILTIETDNIGRESAVDSSARTNSRNTLLGNVGVREWNCPYLNKCPNQSKFSGEFRLLYPPKAWRINNLIYYNIDINDEFAAENYRNIQTIISTFVFAQPISTSVAKPTKAGWYLYENEALGLSFEYPQAYAISVLANGVGVYDQKNYPVIIFTTKPADKIIFLEPRVDIILGGRNSTLYSCPDQVKCPEYLVGFGEINVKEYPSSWSADNIISYTADNAYELENIRDIISTIKFLK